MSTLKGQIQINFASSYGKLLIKDTRKNFESNISRKSRLIVHFESNIVREDAHRPSRIDKRGFSKLSSKIIAGNENSKSDYKFETYKPARNGVAEADARRRGQ